MTTKKKQPIQAPMLNVGASVEGVREARLAIGDILRASVENQTKVEALRTLTTLCNVSNTTITGCTFFNGPKPT